MTSADDTVNLERYIQQFKQDGDIPEQDKDAVLQLVDNLAAEGITKARQRKYIYALKKVVREFAPDGFHLEGADEQQIRSAMASLHRSDLADQTKRDIAVCLKKFYTMQNGGECPQKAAFINTTQKKATRVTREDLIPEADRDKIFAAFRNLRDIAFAITLYESAARPGELASCTIADVECSEDGDFIHLEGSKGTPDRTNQLVAAGKHLREWITRHPAGGDVHDPKDSRAPLWVKMEQTACRACGETPQDHDDEACTYRPQDYERMGYMGWYRAFKRACTRAGVQSHRPYDFRHTRITEVSQFMSHEQLCKFAGWKPGSDRAKVYVHLTNDDVNRAIREEYGMRTDTQREKVECKFCRTKNQPDQLECRNCRRPLSLESAEKQEELQQAVEVYNRLEEAGGIENLQKLETLLANADRIDELVGESM